MYKGTFEGEPLYNHFLVQAVCRLALSVSFEQDLTASPCNGFLGTSVELHL